MLTCGWAKFSADGGVLEKTFDVEGTPERVILGLHVDDGLLSHDTDAALQLVMAHAADREENPEPTIMIFFIEVQIYSII